MSEQYSDLVMSQNNDATYSKTLLDQPINLTRKRIVRNNKLALAPLPETIKPTPYVAQRPVPKPRKKAPVSLPRSTRPRQRPVNRKVNKLIREIQPYFSPEKIDKFEKKLKFLKKAKITKKKNALKNNLANYSFSIMNDSDPSMQLLAIRKILKEKLMRLINEKKGLKFGLSLKLRMKKETEDGVIYREPYFNSKAKTVTHPDMISNLIMEAEEEIRNKIADWLSEGSNWVIELILDHYLNIIGYTPLRGSSYLPLPKELRNPMKGLINLQNEDEKCFLWCHVRHLNPQKKHPERIKLTDKESIKKLDYSGISFPVSYKDYNKIEKQNQININVFGYSSFIYPIHTSKEKYKDHIEVLYIEEGEKSHYVYIKNFNRLMNTFTNHKETKHFCMRCLHCFSREDLLEKHSPDCFALNGTQKIDMPANSATCYICEKEYSDKDKPVRDHCHITGKYRGSAHNSCNLQLRFDPDKIKIPVIFHNLKGYDSHFIIKKLGKNFNISVIAQNFEKYISFTIDALKFLDSFQFMSSSLDKLSNNLTKDKFIYTDLEFKDLTPTELELLKRKGVYPYSYMDSFNRFDETELPPIKKFRNELNNTEISDSEYQHAREVWDAFKIKNLGEYHDLYLKTDVLLLSDIFDNFRDTCLKYYGLDPCHYLTSPGLAWDAMLKMTKIELDLITDIDMALFIEKGLRGGISYIAHRYARANNKYLPDYNPELDDSYLMYLDANNLYGWTMSERLPTGNFKWLENLPDTPEEFEFFLSKYTRDSDKGIILEVDLEYQKELHQLHNDYPCAPEKKIITNDMLSDYARKIKEEHSVSSGKVPKLVTTLNDKEKYVSHYRNLQLYLSFGIRIKKIHRGVEFDQSPWLKEYIDFNTEMRKNAKNSFEKDFFKLMNNSVFGKTMENLRKRVNIELVTDEKRLNKLSAKPTYVSSKIFNENLVGVHTKKERLLLDKPSYVGMCILDLSKTHMYDFHYNYIKKKYPDSQLLFTDTDSLFYHIKSEKDIYEEFWNDRHLFDNSDYPNSSKYFSDENKKVIGKFKDEAAGKPILEFVGLKSKMYSYKIGEEEHKKAKGVKKNVVKKEIKHQDYLDVLFNKKIMHHQMNTIRSESHQINSYHLNKVSLSPYDDKRYLLDDGITSYAYGHQKKNENIILLMKLIIVIYNI